MVNHYILQAVSVVSKFITQCGDGLYAVIIVSLPYSVEMAYMQLLL